MSLCLCVFVCVCVCNYVLDCNILIFWVADVQFSIGWY